jgi:two-component system sensor histidine kinase PilS (NtrC family)
MRRSARGLLWAGTAEVAQAGLMGCGLLALAWLTHPGAAPGARAAADGAQPRRGAHAVAGQQPGDRALADGVLVVDAAGVVHAANPAARTMLGPTWR